jgi:hypothetical protein
MFLYLPLLLETFQFYSYILLPFGFRILFGFCIFFGFRIFFILGYALRRPPATTADIYTPIFFFSMSFALLFPLYF